MADTVAHREADVNGADSSLDEEGECCVVCLARVGPAGVSCGRCQDEFYCGVQHREGYHRVHEKVCFPPRGLKLVAGKAVCTVCGAKGLRCARCGLDAYCGKEHQKQHWAVHKAVCKAPRKDAEDATHDEDEAPLGLAALPRELLLAVCALLGPYDLVRLGHVSRALRSVARDPAAWAHVVFPERKAEADGEVWRAGRTMMAMLDREPAITRALGRDAGYGVLRVAPALGTLRIIHRWPPVNLLRYTRRVRRLELEWMEIAGLHGFGEDKLLRLLRHYRGHLQVLQLPRIEDVATLQFIDGLGLRELRLAEGSVRTYGADGSVKGVAILDAGSNVTEDVVVELLRPCEETLTSFVVKPRLEEFCKWAFQKPEEGVLPALRRCARLVELEAPACWFVNGHLDAFPGLTKLHLTDLGSEKHSAVKRALAAFPRARHITHVSMTLCFQAHRGLVQMVADAFPNLKILWLAFDSDRGDTCMDFMRSRAPDAPRDLAALLDRRLPHLEVLVLSKVRVPKSLLDTVASGTLPNLKKLALHLVKLTRPGLAALKALRAARPALIVQTIGTRPAQRAVGWGLVDEEPERCEDPACAAPSDCESEDPVPTEDEGGEDISDDE